MLFELLGEGEKYVQKLCVLLIVLLLTLPQNALQQPIHVASSPRIRQQLQHH